MSAMAISIVNYIHELKEAGFTDRQSEVQARQLEQVVTEIKNEAAMKKDLNDLATKKDLEMTKKDLELAIEKLRYETLKFVVWTGVGVVVALGGTLGGMMAKGFHWF